MQAVRQCSVCANHAAGGLLRNQTDISLLQKRLKKGAACTRYLSRSDGVFLNSRKPAGKMLGELKTTVNSSMASLSFSHGLYAVPFAQYEKVENLSHDSLIRRAASVVTDGSSTFLSQTTLALIDALKDYSKAVYTLIALQRRYLASLAKLTPAEEDSLQEVIIGQRVEVSERLKDCKHSEATWINAVNLCKMSTEAAYTCGAEQASITVRTNIQVAQSQVQEAQKMSADADKKLAETKVEEIQRMAEYNSSLEDSEGPEANEAYLRED